MYAFLWSSDLHYPFSQFIILILQSLLTKNERGSTLKATCLYLASHFSETLPYDSHDRDFFDFYFPWDIFAQEIAG